MGLEQRTLDRIAKDFFPAERDSVIELLSGYSGPENGRVTWDIVALSDDSLDKVRQYIQIAQTAGVHLHRC